MSLKDNFTKEEWFKVMNGPGRVGAAVAAASPSGLTGVMAEFGAVGDTIRENVSRAGRTPLMEAIAADLLGNPPTRDELKELTGGEGQPKNLDDVKNMALEGVRQAVWLVKAKTSPADAQAYQELLMQVAEATAKAAKEGGFLGIGGEQINDKERAMMTELQGVIRGTDATATSGPSAAVPSTLPAPDGSGNSN